MPHPVHYTVTLADPEAQLLQVRCRIARPNPEGQVLSMAAWLPGQQPGELVGSELNPVVFRR